MNFIYFCKMEELQRIFFTSDDFIILNDPGHLSVIESNEDKWMRVIACQSGEMTASIDDRSVTLHPNDMLFVSAEQRVEQVMVTAGFKFIMFALSKQMHSEIFPSSGVVWQTFHHIRTVGKITLSQKEVDDLKIDFLYLCRRLPDCANLFYTEYIRCIIQAIVYRVASKVAKIAGTPTGKNFMQSPETLSEAFFNLLNSTYPTPRTVSWYATRLNKTPKYLATVIKRTSGKKPTEWITEKAVNEIANMLKGSKKSVKEICVQLNFSSLSFFCRYVRQHLGASPNQYRSLKRRPEMYLD